MGNSWSGSEEHQSVGVAPAAGLEKWDVQALSLLVDIPVPLLSVGATQSLTLHNRQQPGLDNNDNHRK